MPFQYEAEVRQRAEHYIEILQAAGIAGRIVAGSFRDYTVKVGIQRGGRSCGNINIYYSPNKKSYSLRTHELRDRSIEADLQVCWDKPGGDEVERVCDYQAYVDGSAVEGRVGYGAAILQRGEKVAETGGAVPAEDIEGSNQVAGEIEAVHWVLNWCQEHSVAELDIFFDFLGLEKWASGEWQAGHPTTQAYAQFLTTTPVKVHWHKVVSHTNVYWNEYVDKLAKQVAASPMAPEAASSQMTLANVEAKARAFVNYLKESGINATCAGPMNNKFVRVTLRPKSSFDIYNTPKRPISKPDAHGIPDLALRKTVEELWAAFLSDHLPPVLTPSPAPEPFPEIAHYLRVLEPYRDCQFDFVVLANAIERARRSLGLPVRPAEDVRYDFSRLEQLYTEMKNLKGKRS